MHIKTKLYPQVHPLKPVTFGDELPKIAKGKGIYIQDTEGKTYIDGISGLWNVSLGYGNHHIKNAIVEQLDDIPYVNPIQHSNPTTLALAELLLEIVPNNIVKVAYTCTGSESSELAIKIARKYNQIRGRRYKNKIATLNLSYHGSYYGSMTASGVSREIMDDYGPTLSGMVYLPTPVPNDEKRNGGVGYDEIEKKLDDIFNNHGESIAAVMIEPILGSGGSIPLPEKYVKKIVELCHSYDVLLGVDEVATGFGRTGKMFGFEHFNINPDIICVSKGINNGYLPLGATLISNKIYEAFSESNNRIEHLSTQNGNPLACAAGIATINIVKDATLLNHVTNIGEYLRNEIHDILYNHKNYSEVRGKGLMMGIELVKNKRTYECLDYEHIYYLVNTLTQKGLIVYPFYNAPYTTGFHLFPPFCLTKHQTNEIVNIVKMVFDQTIF